MEILVVLKLTKAYINIDLVILVVSREIERYQNILQQLRVLITVTEIKQKKDYTMV